MDHCLFRVRPAQHLHAQLCEVKGGAPVDADMSRVEPWPRNPAAPPSAKGHDGASGWGPGKGQTQFHEGWESLVPPAGLLTMSVGTSGAVVAPG